MANNEILIFGKGFAGSRLREELACQVSDKKIYSLNDAEEEIRKLKPKVIVNCIGHIGRNVDECEVDKDKTLTANTFVPIILAEAALRHNVKFIHLSSGCIYHFDYDKDAPINEEKTPDFIELYYSRTKIYSDRAIEVLAKKYPILILRIRVPLDDRPHPRNILTKLINYKKIINLPNSVTYIPDFIRALKHLVEIDAQGIYNIVNSGGLKYQDILDVYKKYVPDFNYEIVDYKTLNLVRTNLILSTKKLEKTGFNVRNINEVFEECVKNYLKY